MVTMNILRRSFRCCWMDCSCNAIHTITTIASWEPGRDGSWGARARGEEDREGAGRLGCGAGCRPESCPVLERWKQMTSLPVVSRRALPGSPGGPL